jgi:hypothetical protein
MDWSILAKIAHDIFLVDRKEYPLADVLTVAHDNDRSLFYRNRWYSPLIDTIEDDLRSREVKSISVSRVISRIKGEIAHGNVFSPEGSFARALVIKRLVGIFRRKGYPYSKMEEDIWGDILDKSQAKKVLGIQPSRELCVACRKRGVWVADVQHGVISSAHPWYGARFRGSDPIEFLPHAFLCWDKGSQQVIDQWAQDKGVNTLVTGNRWISRFLKRDTSDALVDEMFSIHEKIGGSDSRPTILVSLSWGCENLPNGIMHDSLKCIIRKTASLYRWLVRLHPNQINGFATHEGKLFKSYFSENLEGFAEWELATLTPLPVVLHYSDLHITWTSSVTIEAAQMGVHSALLSPLFHNPTYSEYFRFYRDSGMIDLVSPNDDEIVSWIEKKLFSKEKSENFEDYDVEYLKLLNFLSR